MGERHLTGPRRRGNRVGTKLWGRGHYERPTQHEGIELPVVARMVLHFRQGARSNGVPRRSPCEGAVLRTWDRAICRPNRPLDRC